MTQTAEAKPDSASLRRRGPDQPRTPSAKCSRIQHSPEIRAPFCVTNAYGECSTTAPPPARMIQRKHRGSLAQGMTSTLWAGIRSLDMVD